MQVSEKSQDRARVRGLDAMQAQTKKRVGRKEYLATWQKETRRKDACDKKQPKRDLVQHWPVIDQHLKSHDTITYRTADRLVGKPSVGLVNNAVELGLLRGITAGVFERGEYEFSEQWHKILDRADKREAMAGEIYEALPDVFTVRDVAKIFGVGNTTAQTRLNKLLKQGLLRFEPRGLTVPRTWYKVKE
jgi:hypothetical protein